MKRYLNSFLYLLFGLSVSSCEEFVKIDPPRTELVRQTVFNNDDAASAAVIDLYYHMHAGGFASGYINSVTFLCALSADDAINLVTFDQGYQQFNDNSILPAASPLLKLWSDLYASIYRANAIIEGLAPSTGVSADLKHQLRGEAMFVRAFCHFYLVNLWGDIPLVLVTDYKVNQNIGRTAKGEVYAQIIADLSEAQSLLPGDYSYSNNERLRANRGAATALLARAYLYLGDWMNAENHATSLIEQEELYGLAPLSDVFLKNNIESILQILPQTGNTWDLSTGRTSCRLQPGLLNAFEPGDNRAIMWLNADRAYKYRSGDYSSSEYSVIFRLAEQYLIRAEARTRLKNISGAQQDINAIRHRAGLTDTPADDEQTLLAAIEQERRVELFLEWGHRWLDLKRTGRADDVLASIKPDWEATDALYAIPEAQLLNDPAMRNAQNPGY